MAKTQEQRPFTITIVGGGVAGLSAVWPHSQDHHRQNRTDTLIGNCFAGAEQENSGSGAIFSKQGDWRNYFIAAKCFEDRGEEMGDGKCAEENRRIT